MAPFLKGFHICYLVLLSSRCKIYLTNVKKKNIINKCAPKYISYQQKTVSLQSEYTGKGHDDSAYHCISVVSLL